MFYIDNWHDPIRVVAIVINIVTLYGLSRRYAVHHKEWNPKTIDLWFSLVAWTLGGAILLIQGLLQDFPFSVGTILLVVASLVGGKGLFARGAWGADA